MKEIKIGSKGKGEYVSAVLFSFDTENFNKVRVSALGGKNGKALDVADRVTQLKDHIIEDDVEFFEAHDTEGIRITLKRDR